MERVQTLLNINHSQPNLVIKKLTSEDFNHTALNEDDLDLLYKKLYDLGLEFINEPKLNPKKTAKVAFFKDFEENLLELVQTSFQTIKNVSSNSIFPVIKKLW